MKRARLLELARRLRADGRGNATVEFAFISLFFFGVILVALDFGVYAQQRLKLGQAVEQGAMIAFNGRAGAPVVDTTTVRRYIAAASGLSPTTNFRCNGQAACDATNTAQSMCAGAPATSGGWPVFTAALASGLCASGGTPGYYLVVRSTVSFAAIVVPDAFLGGSTMQQLSVVRLK